MMKLFTTSDTHYKKKKKKVRVYDDLENHQWCKKMGGYYLQIVMEKKSLYFGQSSVMSEKQ